MCPALLLGVVLLGAVSVRADVEIIGPNEILSRTVVRDGQTTFHAEGRTWELVTNPNDPSLSKLGDGRFHPWDPGEVEAAVRAVHGAGRLPDTRIYVLPFPRRAILKSSCDGSAIFLSPGIREVPVEHLHMTVAHEIGHVVQHELAPQDSPQWKTYLSRRGLQSDRFHAGAAHRDRPAEIFAEDFRLLFGGDVAVRAGAIENPDLKPPDAIPGLRLWFHQLFRAPRTAVMEPNAGGGRSFPNPFVPATDHSLTIRFARPDRAGTRFHADLFDLSGRLVRSLDDASLEGDDVVFRWNGRGQSGRRAASGVYFVRWNEHPELGTVRVQVLH